MLQTGARGKIPLPSHGNPLRILAETRPLPTSSLAGQLVYPGRQTVAVVGDGGFAMLMAELTTAVQHSLPVKVLILNNSRLA
jgi:pyruvate dehydrogenase (quinone)